MGGADESYSTSDVDLGDPIHRGWIVHKSLLLAPIPFRQHYALHCIIARPPARADMGYMFPRNRQCYDDTWQNQEVARSGKME